MLLRNDDFLKKKEKLVGRSISVSYIEYYEYYISKGILVEKEDPNAKNPKPKTFFGRFFARISAKISAFHEVLRRMAIDTLRDGEKTFLKLMDEDKEDGFPVQRGNIPPSARKPRNPAVSKTETPNKDQTNIFILAFILYPDLDARLLDFNCLYSFAFILFCVVSAYIVFDE